MKSTPKLIGKAPAPAPAPTPAPAPAVNDIGIDIPGFLKNMLNEGFSTLHCLSELIDDSQGANASSIRIIFDGSAFVLSDSGDGMNREKLSSAHCFHARSSVSKKHGRFGIGRKHALVHYTGLKGCARTISRSATDKALSQLDINFPDICRTGRITLHAHGIEEESRPLWDKYAVDKDRKGTITYISTEKTVLDTLIRMAKSPNIKQNLSYYLGTTYNKYLLSGTMDIDVNGMNLKVYPIDRLCWNLIEGDDKKEIIVDIYYNVEDKTDIRAYFTQSLLKTNSGKYGYFKDGKGNFIKGDPPTEYRLLGKTRLRCAYSNDWLKLQRADFTRIGIAIPGVGENGRHEFDEHVGGTELERNEKVIAVFLPTKAMSGDTSKYKYTYDSRYCVSFSPVSENQDEFTLDDIYNVQINKSRVDEGQIHSSVWKTIRKIQDNFATNCYQRHEPAVAPVTTNVNPLPVTRVTAPQSTAQPTAPQSTAQSTAPQSTAPQSTAPQSTAPQPTAQPTAPQSTAPQSTAPQATPPTVVTKKEATLPKQIATTSVTEVSPHTRLGSKSERDIVLQVFELVSSLSNIKVESIIDKTSNTTQTGLTEVYRGLTDAHAILKKYIP